MVETTRKERQRKTERRKSRKRGRGVERGNFEYITAVDIFQNRKLIKHAHFRCEACHTLIMWRQYFFFFFPVKINFFAWFWNPST